MNSIKFIVPYPVSANRNWRHINGKVRLSKQAQRYRTQVGWLAKIAGAKTPFTNNIKVELEITPGKSVQVTIKEIPGKASGRCIDVDNAAKVLLDGLEGICYENDRQITELVIRRIDS